MRKVAASLLIATLVGCAAPVRRSPQDEGVRLDVPYYSDEAGRRGPAALASLLSFWDRPTEPRELRDEVRRPRQEGTLPVDLLLAAQARGLQARSYQAAVDDVKTELKLGHPVLAFVDLGAWLPRGSFVVITGFDDRLGGFYVHANRHANRFVEYRSFMSRWDKTGRWALLITPVGAS